MKKVTGLLAVFALTAALFSGCQPKKNVTIDVAALADDLKNTVPFVDTLAESKDASFLTIYGIEESDIKAKKNYVGSGTAEEITVIEAIDKDAANRIRKAVDDHITDYKDQFQDYAPEEVKKLSDPVIVQTGNYIILCVSDHNDAAEQCIEKYTK